MLPLSYGLGTLAALWAFGGGDPALFWSRQLPLAAILLILGLNVVFLQKRGRIFRGHSGTIMLAAGSALATAIPVVVLIWMGRHLETPAIPFLKQCVANFRPPNFGLVLVTGLLVSAGHEIISRGLLTPAWGISGVAFLDALAVGFGLQQVLPFLLIWGLGYFWGFLARQFGFLTALISHMLWAFIVLSALYAI